MRDPGLDSFHLVLGALLTLLQILSTKGPRCWNSGSCCGWNWGSCRGWSSDGCGPCALVLYNTYMATWPPPFLLQVILPYFSSGYELGSQGKFIEEAFHYIVYSYDRLPRATTSLPPAKVGTERGLVTTTNDPSSTIDQQPNATRYCSAVDGMIIWCSQWFAQLPTILTYMSLTRTCNVLHASTEIHHLQSNYPISWYLPSFNPYSHSPKPS